MGFSLYPNQLSVGQRARNAGLWTTASVNTTEVDLRQEMRDLLHGSSTEIAKGQLGLLRRIRRGTDGRLLVCPCVDKLTKEPDKDFFCPYCHGEGYLWDEEWVTFYKVTTTRNESLSMRDMLAKHGNIFATGVFFYMEHFVNPSRYDKIVEVRRDLDGSVTSPYTRTNIYSISMSQPFRSDNGRIEFWRVAVVEDAVASTWQGDMPRE